MQQRTLVEKRVKEIKRRTRKKYNAEEKIRIVLEGLQGESSIAGLCRREGINQNTLPHRGEDRWGYNKTEEGRMGISNAVRRRYPKDSLPRRSLFFFRILGAGRELRMIRLNNARFL